MMSSAKAFSQACENNKVPILAVLKQAFAEHRNILEIGAGTGQHSVHFAPGLPHLYWQPSDLELNHASILAWQSEFPAVNLAAPIAFHIGKDDWPVTNADGAFTANTTHIMQPQEVKLMMTLVSEYLPVGGVFCQYGPFKVKGEYTSDSNRVFDQHLLASGYGGQQDIAKLQTWASDLTLKIIHQLPANNLLLEWHKI